MSRDPTRDMVRGLTSLEMTFVNLSGLGWTAHSPFVGQVTYADTIFPCFAFLAGMSRSPARRNAGLVGLGLGLHAAAAVANGRPVVRLPGVLQRLGLAGLLADEPALAPLRCLRGAPLVALWYAVTLLGASAASAANPLAHPDLLPAADPAGLAQSRIDRFLFGSRHLYRPGYDPEGLLGCLTTAVSMVLGRAFQEEEDTTRRAATALAAIAVGQALHHLVPRYGALSKSLWTPSFVLVTAGTSALKYLAVQGLAPRLPARVKEVLRAVGARSLEVYVLSTLLTILMRLGGERSFLQGSLRLLGPVLGPAGADFAVSSGLTALMAVCAKALVALGWRIRW